MQAETTGWARGGREKGQWQKESERRASQTKGKSRPGGKSSKREKSTKKNLPLVSEWEEWDTEEEEEDREEEKKRYAEKRSGSLEEETEDSSGWLSPGSPLCRDTCADLIKLTPAGHISTSPAGPLPDRSKGGKKGRGAKGVRQLLHSSYNWTTPGHIPALEGVHGCKLGRKEQKYYRLH